ncbi:MAG: hypothetical protein AAFS10_05010, partial [Myxococcota bacterium]
SLRAKGIPEFKVSIEKTVAGFDSQYNDKLLTIKSEVRDLEQQMHINLEAAREELRRLELRVFGAV